MLKNTSNINFDSELKNIIQQKWLDEHWFRLDLDDLEIEEKTFIKIFTDKSWMIKGITEKSISRGEVTLSEIAMNMEEDCLKMTIVYRLFEGIADQISFFTDEVTKKSVSKLIEDVKNRASKVENDSQEPSSHFYMVTVDKGDLTLKNESVPEVILDLSLNYGKDFEIKYRQLIDDLVSKKPGIVLFYGDVGTGKKHLLKKVISDVASEKTVIYLPTYLLADLASPDFISFLTGWRDSILIVEDAEDAILHRKDIQSNQIVNNMINLTSGLMAHELNIQILVTSNVDKKHLDKSLLRPATIYADHKFGKLTAQEATVLSKSLDINKEWTTPATIAEVYANDVDLGTNKKKRKRVGFNDKEEE